MGAILVLAREKSINTVLQVALYRPDRKKEYKLAVNGTPKDLLPNEVIRHFRDINKVKELVAMVASTQLRIDVHKDLFQKQKGCKLRTQEKFREDYFDKVAKKIKEYGDAVIVFLDPDTGIAPKTYSYNHVTCKEIQKSCGQ